MSEPILKNASDLLKFLEVRDIIYSNLMYPVPHVGADCENCKYVEFRVKSSDKCEHSEGYYSCKYKYDCYIGYCENTRNNLLDLVDKTQYQHFEKKED